LKIAIRGIDAHKRHPNAFDKLRRGLALSLREREKALG
jgi:hypothetical protein